MDGFFFRGFFAAAALAAVAAAAPATASASPPCGPYAMSQPFLSWHDRHEYTLMPGETVDNVDGVGWQLSNGAKLESATLHDGTVAEVLDMPAGSVAVTPPMCVNASFASARAMVADVTGAQGVAVSVSYQVGSRWEWPFAAGMIKNTRGGWSPSKPIMLHSTKLRGSYMMRLTLTSYGGEYQLYNVYVDPRHSH